MMVAEAVGWATLSTGLDGPIELTIAFADDGAEVKTCDIALIDAIIGKHRGLRNFPFTTAELRAWIGSGRVTVAKWPDGVICATLADGRTFSVIAMRREADAECWLTKRLEISITRSSLR